ncbi:MAG: (2Fe-2S)-binding protein [Dehalococcoidia bacterium]|nr:(2Fe-2S)-binding protein [Dehalococcoidia bacterium]
MAKVHLAIDGVDVEVDQGTTILEAAREAGIYIPTLCFHPDLPLSLAVCRLCVVEATEAESRFPSSCVTPVAWGMIVRTDTPAVKEIRRHFFKAIFSPLPSPRLNMPELKKLADYIGVGEEDFPPYVFKNLPVDRDQPLLELDHNRCILCELCIRACKKELGGTGAIDFDYRGGRWMVVPFPSPSLKENGCRFCGLCVEVCPTGALRYKKGESN